MYILFGTILLILPAFFFINHRRRQKIITKIRAMPCDEKCNIIDELAAPFGLSYFASQDILVSRNDVYRKQSCYHFHLILYHLPIYFHYEDKTWLVELRRGQYGINTGGEIDIYYADGILDESEIKSADFHCVSDEDMPELSFCLYRKGVRIAEILSKQWWIAAFSMGRFSLPADLFMQASITFPCREMAWAFVNSLKAAGYCKEDFCVTLNTVTFYFVGPDPHSIYSYRLRTAAAQYINRFWCGIYLFVTRDFCLSLDRLLYLYYYFPFVFCKMLCIRKYNRTKQKRKNLL